jgi:hypothetical protein
VAQAHAFRRSRGPIALAVSLAHLWLLWAMLLPARLQSPSARDAPVSTWLIVDTPEVLPVVTRDAPPPPAVGKSVPPEVVAAPPAASVPDPGVDTTARPRVDWQAQGAQVASQAAERMHAPVARSFGESPRSPYKTCKPRRSSWEWKPEPGKVGMAGLLPFVRVGERCVVGLGFFGCALGEPPPANGKLLDDMERDDRPRSSTPGSEHCEEDDSSDAGGEPTNAQPGVSQE